MSVLSETLHTRPEEYPQIYAFFCPALDHGDHKGYIKIGYTGKEDVNERIEQEGFKTLAIDYKVLLVESAMRTDGTSFMDHDVHRILKRKGIKHFDFDKNKKNEWYKCTADDVRSAIVELRTGIRTEDNRTQDFKMRDEQEMAVNLTASYFSEMKQTEPNSIPKFLWNAKMRFGKTFATYQLARKMGMKRVLVLTFKPAVESAWQEDLMSHVDFEGWQFVSDKEAKYDNHRLDEMYDKCDKTRPIVVFGSFQNLLGTNDLGGIKAKNEFIHTNNWDLVVFDEYHFGAWRENAKKLFEKYDEENSDFDIEEYQKEEAGNAINETWLPITTDYYLYLSGTPFRALNNGEFLEEQIFNWTYSDEQNAKLNWDYSRGKNPYASLPKMVMLTYKVPDSITQVAVNEGYDEFDINEFFKATYEKNRIEESKFIYEDYVQKWIKLIQGDYMPVDGIKNGVEKPPMPFSDTTLLNVLSHTLWFLPNVASCYAMRNLLRQKQNKFFDDYEIIVCAGTKAGVGLDALYPVQRAMDNPLKTKTITLSCGKLTTGVTVRPWSGIFMLRNLKSPETYFQAAFRVQSPWDLNDDEYNKVVLKEECYIFDFALNRALSQISDYSCRLSIDDTSPEKKVGEFIRFLPILAFDGSGMSVISAQDVLDITYAGTTATLLAKRWQTALLVHVDNDTLKKLQANPDALNALMNIEGFRNLSRNIETIINRSERIKNAKKEHGDDPSDKKKREISEEEKEIKSLRKQVQDNLLKLAARIPAFMYLTDYREQCIKDVITQIQPQLFKKVTGLEVKDFELLCSIGLFDSEKMNQGIFGFRRYENASLSYTGFDMHEGENVGGWDTVLTREEYNELYDKQQATMTDFMKIIVPDHTQTKQILHKDISIKHRTASGNHAEEVNTNDDNVWEEKLAGIDVGSTINHKRFGEGRVVKFEDGRQYVTLRFDVGEKRFPFISSFKNGYLYIDPEN